MVETSQNFCRVCASGTKNVLLVRSWPLNACSACGFVQVDRKPSQKELDHIYSETYLDPKKYEESTSLKMELKRRLEIFTEANTPPGGKVLEIGCATGFFLKPLMKDFEVYGTDYSPHSVSKIQTEFPEMARRLQSGQIDQLEYPLGSFDTIVMWDVLEHLWDVQNTAEQLKKWLKPSGHLVLSSPNMGAFSAKLMGSRWAFMTPPEHLSFFNKGALKTLFEGKGFRLKSFRSRGKWVNFGFLIYKIGRVFPLFGRLRLQDHLPKMLSQRSLYVPTGDIFYAVLQRDI